MMDFPILLQNIMTINFQGVINEFLVCQTSECIKSRTWLLPFCKIVLFAAQSSYTCHDNFDFGWWFVVGYKKGRHASSNTVSNQKYIWNGSSSGIISCFCNVLFKVIPAVMKLFLLFSFGCILKI